MDQAIIYDPPGDLSYAYYREMASTITMSYDNYEVW